MGDIVGATVAFASIFLAMMVAGSPVLYMGWQRRTRYALLRETADASPATVQDGDTVLLTGTAALVDEPVFAPVSGDDALVAAWDLLEWRDAGRASSWMPVARGLRTAHLRLQGESGTVTVDEWRDEATTSTRNKLTGPSTVTGPCIGDVVVETDEFDGEIDIEPDEQCPDRLRSLERLVGIDEPREEASVSLLPWTPPYRTRRYREVTVADGDPLTVRATVRRDGESVSLAIPEDGTAVLSTLDSEALLHRYRRAYRKLLYGITAISLVMGLLAALVVLA